MPRNLSLNRHEIAFVFGQLLSPHSVPCLVEVLKDGSESDMVRHEAAEALGGIATPEVLPYLKEWMTRDDSPTVVKESCQVALDMWEVRVHSTTILKTLMRFCSTKILEIFSMPMVWITSLLLNYFFDCLLYIYAHSLQSTIPQ